MSFAGKSAVGKVTPELALQVADAVPIKELMALAAEVRDARYDSLITYSRKVFIPLTRLCRDVCHYCTFATTPSRVRTPYLSPEGALEIARQGAAAGCDEALITLGDRPEARYSQARDALRGYGLSSTVEYIESVARRVLRETGLLPHINAGALTEQEYHRLRAVAPSMGIMLETTAERLSHRGGPHFGSPDKYPSVRLESLRAAGRADVPITSGILIGIGETRVERIEALLALRSLHEEFGHIQEVIVQNFRPKAGTKMQDALAPSDEEMLWTVAMARLILGTDISIQAPPNLNASSLRDLIDAGINDWGGVSPVTPDHVNPECPWPAVSRLREASAECGKILTERLTVYPAFINERGRWLHKDVATAVLHKSDSEGLARLDAWKAGTAVASPRDDGDGPKSRRATASLQLQRVLYRAQAGEELAESEIVRLFAVRAGEYEEVKLAADEVRRAASEDVVTYVVNRNINYTNICTYHCTFCAFAKGHGASSLRGPGYLIELEEVSRRTAEAARRGGTEVCLQGGIHPAFTGDTYLQICRAAKEGDPAIHVHAFSPLEIRHGADTLGVSVGSFLERLQLAGLATLPGTAAEILDDSVRRDLCPDKLTTQEWLEIIATAHSVGLPTTATIMYGHIDNPIHWARHLSAIRRLQSRTGGFTEFVPLPFVADEAPLFRHGQARPGPTWREAVLMHAVARLALHPVVKNIQASWPKLGPQGAMRCLAAGVNDLGGTLMNESISRAAGAVHGQELAPQEMEHLILGAGRTPAQRTTLYGRPSAASVQRSFAAAPLIPILPGPARAGIQHRRHVS